MNLNYTSPNYPSPISQQELLREDDSRVDRIQDLLHDTLTETMQGNSFESNFSHLLAQSNDRIRSFKDDYTRSKENIDNAWQNFLNELEFNIPDDLQNAIQKLISTYSSHPNFDSYLDDILNNPQTNLSPTEKNTLKQTISNHKSIITNLYEVRKNLSINFIQGLNTQVQARQLDLLKRQALYRLTSQTGLNFNDIQNKTIEFQYNDTSSNLQTGIMKFKQISLVPNTLDPNQPTTYQSYFSVEITNPKTGEVTDLEFTESQLISFLTASNALESNINSFSDLDNSLGWAAVGLSIQNTSEISYITDTKKKQNLTITNSGPNSITLSQAVRIHGQDKATLSLSEFAKWANGSFASPIITKANFEAKLPVVKENIAASYGIDPQDIDLDIPFQAGQILTSILNGSSLTIGSVTDSSLEYEINGQKIKKPLGQALVFLNNLAPQGIHPDSVTTTETPDETPVSEPESSSNSTEENKQAPPKDSYKGADATWHFKPPGPITMFKKVTTLNGAIKWLNYREASTIIKEAYSSWSEGIDTERKRKLGNYAKNFKNFGGTFKNMEKSAKGEIVKGHKDLLSQLSPNEIINELFNADTFFKFYAALDLLKEQGMIPVRDRRFANRLNHFLRKMGLSQHLVNFDGENANYENATQAYITALNAFLDYPAGDEMMAANKSKFESNVNRYKANMDQIIGENANAGMVLLHNALSDYVNNPKSEVSEAQIQGYVLSAINEGVGYQEIMGYIIQALTLENKAGVKLLTSDFLASIKKAHSWVNFFVVGNKDIINYLAQNDCYIDLSSKKSSSTPPEERFRNYNKASKAFWVMSQSDHANKTKLYLEDGINTKDYAFANMATVPYDELRKLVVPDVGGLTNRTISLESITNYQKQAPGFFQAHCELTADSEGQNFRRSHNFNDYVDSTRDALANWYMIYASTRNIAYIDNRTKKTLSESDRLALEKHVGPIRALLQIILQNEGLPPDQIYDILYKDHTEDQDQSRGRLKATANESLHRQLKKIPRAKIEAAMAQAHRENIFTDKDAWSSYVISR